MKIAGAPTFLWEDDWGYDSENNIYYALFSPPSHIDMSRRDTGGSVYLTTSVGVVCSSSAVFGWDCIFGSFIASAGSRNVSYSALIQVLRSSNPLGPAYEHGRSAV